MFSVVIVSAGKSQRYKQSPHRGNKTLELIGDLPVFLHSLLLFLDRRYREIILVVSPDDHRDQVYASILSQYRSGYPTLSGLDSRLRIIPGGEERVDSVQAGLRSCSSSSKWVLIHDAARPLLHPEDLSSILSFMDSHDHTDVGVIPVSLPSNTIKQVDGEGWVTGNLPRATLREAITPQCFPTHLLREAYDKLAEVGDEAPTDDSEVYFSAGHPILTLTLKHPNPKLTTPADYEIMKKIWEMRTSQT